VIRNVEKATALRPGTIVISKYRVTSRGPDGHPARFTIETLYETPAGPGPQNMLYINSEHLSSAASERAISGGNEEIYVAKTNTIYISSVWGPYITKGTKPGTFLYTPPKPRRVRSAVRAAKPLMLTAAQADALLDGTDTVLATPHGSRVPYHVTLSVAPALRLPRRRRPRLSRHAQVPRHQSNRPHEHRRTPRDRTRGPQVQPPPPRYGGGDAGVEAWVDPKTYLPIKEVTDRLPLFEDIQTWTEYKILPITLANERLLSLTARHPHAHVDRNHYDYLKTANDRAGSTSE
jgi:hypothetical protein